MVLELLVTITGFGDVSIRPSPSSTVANLVAAFGGTKAHTFTVIRSGTALDRDQLLVEAPIRSGDTLKLYHRAVLAESVTGRAPATLKVTSGPAIGTAFELTYGKTSIGRAVDNDITIVDPGLSRRHATLTITRRQAELADNGSTNGVRVNDEPVTKPVRLQTGDTISMGETAITVELRAANPATSHTSPSPNRSKPADAPTSPSPNQPEPADAPTSPSPNRSEPAETKTPSGPNRSEPSAPRTTPAPPEFHRRSRSLNRYTGSVLTLPLPPPRPRRMVLSPAAQQRYQLEVTAHESKLHHLQTTIETEHRMERRSRLAESPSIRELAEIVATISPRLWERSLGDPDFAEVRVGLGRGPSRTRLEVPPADLEPHPELEQFAQTHSTIDNAPIVVDLKQSLRLAGYRKPILELSASLVLQLASLHSPSDLVMAAYVGPSSSTHWDWLKWLPHCADGTQRFGAHLLAANPKQGADLSRALVELLDVRSALTAEQPRPTNGPAVVVIVDEAAPIDDATLTALVERGPANNVYLLWLAENQPRADRFESPIITVLAEAGWSDGRESFVATIENTDGVFRGIAIEGCQERLRDRLARSLTPIIDRSQRASEQGPHLPPVCLKDLHRGARPPSTFDAQQPGRRRTLRAPIGRSAHGGLSVDLVTSGPHAIVTGDQSSGKTTLLHAWVSSLAVSHWPSRLQMMLVTSPTGEGGLLARAGGLAHVIASNGASNDLTPLRASLADEADLRQRFLKAAGARSLNELAGRDNHVVPPELVVVIDDLASWVETDPDNSRAIVDLVDASTSLGFHLIASVEGPHHLSPPLAAMIDGLEGARVCLRVTDPEVSRQVIGTTEALTIERATPGRGWLRSGKAEPVLFQAALASNPNPEPEELMIEPFKFTRVRSSRRRVDDGAGPGLDLDSPSGVESQGEPSPPRARSMSTMG